MPTGGQGGLNRTDVIDEESCTQRSDTLNITGYGRILRFGPPAKGLCPETYRRNMFRQWLAMASYTTGGSFKTSAEQQHHYTRCYRDTNIT
jgi:hypothetical protein